MLDREPFTTRLWLGPVVPGPDTRLFRRRVTVPGGARRVSLEIFAESVYHVWLNGQYLGRGPAYHHPFRRPVDSYDLTDRCVAGGENMVAVLVHAPNLSLHNGVMAGEPGLVARLSIVDAHDTVTTIDADARWKATDRTGWSADVPRRSWAIGHIESFDANLAPAGWQVPAFDDSAWPPAEVLPATALANVEWIDRPVPALRYGFQPAATVEGLFAIAGDAPPVSREAGGPAAPILQAAWDAPDADLRVSPIDPATGAIAVEGLRPDRGAVLVVDLGEEFVGQAVFDADCPAAAAGTIDLGWAERYLDGKPAIVAKGCGYCDRIIAKPGRVSWQPIGYSGMRYLVVTLRGFGGTVRFTRLGVLTSEPDVQWPARFESDDDALNRIWRLSQRTIRVGTQEGLIDCPTREQAPYIGDGVLIGRWFTQLTGDARHWRHLVDDQFRRQAPNGLLRSSIYSGVSSTLIDYSLLAILGLRDYVRHTRDTEPARQWVAACHRIVGWFDARRDARGLCVTDWSKPGYRTTWEQRYDPAQPRFDGPDDINLFIDHPGMGWHNVGEAGVDRRGTNAALNALLVLARRALADLERAAGDHSTAAQLDEHADRLAVAVRQAFFDPQCNLFVDGTLDDKRLAQVSEQTNTWAIAARCCDDNTARAILTNLLTSDNPAISRNGPYFWTYLLPQLARLGLHELALTNTRELWRQMLAGGATTLWETWTGDHLDSWCHPWSGAAVEFLPTHVAGLPGVDADLDDLELRPRYDLLSHCSASTTTRRGLVSIHWQRNGGLIKLGGALPDGVRARIVDPTGTPIGDVSGSWESNRNAQ